MKSSLLAAAALALLLSADPAPGQTRKTPSQQGRSDPTPARPPAVRAWEYKELSRSAVETLAAKDSATPFVSGLNSLGAEGWELAAVEPGSGGRVTLYLFKRPAPAGQGKQAKKAEKEDEPPVQIVRLKHATAAQLAKTLTAVFRKAQGAQFVAEERTNSLVITADLNTMREAVRVITALDEPEEKPAPQKK
jgi:hypothetical protein